LNTKMPTISRHAMEKLISYHWPGNVRELQNVIDRSSIISTGGKLQVDLAPPPLQDTHDPTSVMTDAEMTSVMRANIVNALRKAKGKVAGSQGAADMLMVQPTTLYSRIKKLRIQPEDWL
jgi:hydrogenase-4 transcriptional activator